MKNLNDLRDIQRAIQVAVQSKQNSPVGQSVLLETPPISIQQRLKIYQDSYEVRLEESLRDDFELVQAQLSSEEAFDKIIKEFILNHPSRVRNIAEYSEDFTIFAQKNYPEIYDEALCDWFALMAAKMPDVSKDLVLSVEAIQQGQSFCLRVFLSTIVFKSEIKYYTTLRRQDEIETLEISSDDYKLLQLLSKPYSVEGFIEEAQRLNIQDEVIATKINEWISNQIIYCERI